MVPTPITFPGVTLGMRKWRERYQGAPVASQTSSYPLFMHRHNKIHQYATLTSPNKGKTVVCGSPTFLLDDRGGDHWLPQIGLRSPGHGSTLLTWSVGIISSDYCHLSKTKLIVYFNYSLPLLLSFTSWRHRPRSVRNHLVILRSSQHSTIVRPACRQPFMAFRHMH